MFLLNFCLFFPVNFGFFKKSFHIGVPFLLKGLIHAEGAHGNAGNALENGTVVVEIQVQPRDILRGKGTDLVSVKKVPEVFRREGEDDLKIKGRPFSLNEGETEVPNLPPVGMVTFWFLVEEVFMQETVESKFVESRDFAFDKGEIVESVLE